MGNTEQWRYSLDLDGTLYTLKPRTGATVEGSVRFRQSEFAYAIKENANRFLQDTLGISEAEAMAEYERIYKKYDGEISLAVEKEYNVDRYTYFNRTWDLDPALFITPEGNVREAITVLNGRMELLTSGPRIWATRALTYLKVDDLFTNITTGEPDIRKPNPEVFRQIVASFGVPAENVISIGDQHYSDIIPAKSIGMKGIIVGQKLESADVRIDSIQDLVPTLQTFGWI